MTKPKKDPDLGLDLYRFNIPTLKVLREVMIAEQKAVAEIRAEITRISSASDSMLVDPQGKPIPQVGGTGTAAQATGVIAGGALASLTLITNPGSYSVPPSNPVTVSGGGLIGATVNLQTGAVITHTFLTGWFGCISKQQPPDPTLLGVSQLQLAINRELSAAGQPAIILSNITPSSLLQDLRFQPLFLGSNYPFGNLI